MAVSCLGLGCMGLSGAYRPGRSGQEPGHHRRRARGRRQPLHSGDFYGMGHNEMLLGKALRGQHGKPFLAVKFGAQRDPGGAFIGFDGRPTAVKSALAYTLRRLAQAAALVLLLTACASDSPPAMRSPLA